MKKIIIWLIIVFIIFAIIGVAIFNNKNDENSKIVATVGPEPVSIDPQIGSTIDCRVYMRHMFEGLTRIDKDGNVIPGMAEKWDIDETETQYTFYIRDAKWSDGKEVSAKDFEFAWKRLLNPETASEVAYKLYFVKNAEKYNKGNCSQDDVGIVALDDKTFQVTLERPTSYFLTMLCYENLMPVRQDIVDKDGKWTQNANTYVSNGAFKLKEWIHGSKIIMEKNENYWDKNSIKTSEIEFLLIDDYVAGLNAFESGQLDINDAAYPPEDVSRLIENGSMNISPYLSTYYYNFNTTKEPFNDVKVRKAFSLAIDREYIVNSVTKAGEKEAVAYIPDGIKVGENNYREISNVTSLNKNANIEEARKLLAEAGYPNGENFPSIEIVFNTSEEHKKIAEAIQHDLKENLGINVTIKNVEWSTLSQILTNKDYTVARNGQIADYDDPLTFLDGWVTGGTLNFSGWSNEEYDKLISIITSTTDENLRLQSIERAEEIILDELPICPIYWYVQKILVNEHLKDAYISPLGGYYLHYAYIEKTE